MTKVHQVPVGNSFKSTPSIYKHRHTSLFGKKFDKALLRKMYELRGHDLSYHQLTGAMGYLAPATATRAKKGALALEEKGYLRIVKMPGRSKHRFHVLKGLPEVSPLPDTTNNMAEEVVREDLPKQPKPGKETSEASLAPLQFGLSELARLGFHFQITISSEEINRGE